MRDLQAVEHVLHRDQVQPDLLLHDAHACADSERRIEIHHAGVKAVTRVGSHAAIAIELIGRPEMPRVIGEVPVFKHHTLGHAGSAGGVKEYEQILRGRMVRQLLTGGKRGKILCQKNGALVVRNLFQKILIRDQESTVGVLHHKAEAVRGIAGIKRLIGRSRLQRSQRRRDHHAAAVDQDGYHFPPAHSVCA